MAEVLTSLPPDWSPQNAAHAARILKALVEQAHPTKMRFDTVITFYEDAISHRIRTDAIGKALIDGVKAVLNRHEAIDGMERHSEWAKTKHEESQFNLIVLAAKYAPRMIEAGMTVPR